MVNSIYHIPMMKPSPPGWPRLSSAIFYRDPLAAIAWLERAFGFETRTKIVGADGSIEHSELTFGEAVIMVGSVTRGNMRASPRMVDGLNTQGLLIYVDDLERHFSRARDAGAKILNKPALTDHGPEYWADRLYEAEDCEGHRWWFAERLRTGK